MINSEDSKSLNCNWYIISVKKGKEEKVVNDIKENLERDYKELAQYVKEFKWEEKKIRGYIFCHCYLSQKLLNFFYRTEYLSGFLNYKKNLKELPEPVSEQVINKFFSQSNLSKETEEEETNDNKEIKLEIGDLVKINEGTFNGYEGRIISFDEKKTKVRIEIDFLGQTSSLELPINNCQRVL